MLKTFMFFLLVCFLYVQDDSAEHDHLSHTPIQIKMSESKKGILI